MPAGGCSTCSERCPGSNEVKSPQSGASGNPRCFDSSTRLLLTTRVRRDSASDELGSKRKHGALAEALRLAARGRGQWQAGGRRRGLGCVGHAYSGFETRMRLEETRHCSSPETAGGPSGAHRGPARTTAHGVRLWEALEPSRRI